MMATGRCTEGSLAKSITEKCSHQLLQTNDTRGLPSPAFKGNRSAVLKKKVFPVLHGAVIEGDMGEAHSYASCGHRFNPGELRWPVSSVAGTSAKVYTSSYL